MSDEDSTKESDTIMLDGVSERLPNGHEVFVGQKAGDSSVFIRFWNGNEETLIKLTHEAACALRELLGMTNSRGLISTSRWTFVTEVADIDDTAPAEAS